MQVYKFVCIFFFSFFLLLGSFSYSKESTDSKSKKSTDSTAQHTFKVAHTLLIKKIFKCDSIIKLYSERTNQRIDSSEKSINIRFDDARTTLGALTTLMIGIITAIGTISYFKGKSTAKETAQEEFDKKFRSYHKRIKKIEADALTLLKNIELHEAAATSFNTKIEDLKRDVDGKSKEVLENAIKEFLQKKLT